jgi:nitrogen-specific signal transduction histidine kinase
MAAKLVRSWRGRIRAQLQEARKDINSLLAYNTKNPTVGFLSAAQVIVLNSALTTVLAPLIAATKPR